VIVGVIAACLQLFPTGDMLGKQIAQNQPVTLAAMEGLFEAQQGAPLAILGQPDVEKRRLDTFPALTRGDAPWAVRISP
jgi:cytochrome d ubiquinol oxidase subunit I